MTFLVMHKTLYRVCFLFVTQSLKNITINSNFNAIILSVDIHMKKEFRINLLEHILTLYFRVRAFSFAKDVREKHRAAHKELRKRSLRTEIKKASSMALLKETDVSIHYKRLFL